jgi:TonB family protein
MVSAQIGLLDVEPPVVAAPPGRGWWASSPSRAVIRAAILVLLAAAAASALPGSPVREWVFGAPEPESPVVDTEPVPAMPELARPATAMLEGTVRAAGGGPLSFAHLEVVTDTVSGWSDESGGYLLEGPPGARWVVRATHPGYRPVERDVVLPASGRVALDLFLEAIPGPVSEPLADFRPFTVAYTLPALVNADEVAAAIQRRYPAHLEERRAEGQTVLRLWLDEQGRVARSTLSRTSGEAELDALALGVAREMRFNPATNLGEPVRVIVLMPVRFVAPDRPPSPS